MQLLNGLVLVVGGAGCVRQRAASAELYNPATGTSTQTALRLNGRAAVRRGAAGDGRVLITGGTGTGE
jgi:hypothetical protein